MSNIFKKKGSLNLSINAIVVLILAITMLGLGLTFVTNIFTNADAGLSGAFKDVERQRAQKLVSICDKEVCFEMNKIDIKKGKETDFYILFNNPLSEDVTFDMSGTTDCHRIGTTDNSECSVNAESVVSMWMDMTVTVPSGGFRVIPVKIKALPSATKNTIIFNIDVQESAAMNFHSIETVTVNVDI